MRPPCTTAVGGLGICKFMEVPFVNTPFPFEALPHQSALQWWVSQGASVEGHAPRWFHPQHWGAPLFLPLPMLFFFMLLSLCWTCDSPRTPHIPQIQNQTHYLHTSLACLSLTPSFLHDIAIHMIKRAVTDWPSVPSWEH